MEFISKSRPKSKRFWAELDSFQLASVCEQSVIWIFELQIFCSCTGLESIQCSECELVTCWHFFLLHQWNTYHLVSFWADFLNYLEFVLVVNKHGYVSKKKGKEKSKLNYDVLWFWWTSHFTNPSVYQHLDGI